jgi:hypothetical protein
MDNSHRTSWIRRGLAAAALCTVAHGTALAAPMKIEAVVVTKTESRLDFADGTKRYMLATQREGKTVGEGLLAGTSMLEWGVHDVDPATGAHANGYLLFTGADTDIAYLRYLFRAVPVTGPDGKQRFVVNGVWETVGGTGKFKGLRGAGTVRIQAPSPKERLWLLDGELATVDSTGGRP